MKTVKMIRSAKGKFIWPGMKTDLGIKYKECNECLMHSKENIDKPDQQPDSLISLFPGERIYVDFLEVMGKDIFLVADHVSSHVFGKNNNRKELFFSQECPGRILSSVFSSIYCSI